MFTNLVAFPLGFWWSAPVGLIVVRHGRGVQGAPADSGPRERAARANGQKRHAPTGRHCDDKTARGPAKLLQIGQNQVPATHRTSSSYHPRALPQPSCNIPARTQR